ncbi:MAG: hypothetical protein HY938_01850 [Nitrosomonadales bacterium]|nr:hypothetical protein [Nitrosomonadales bacterium]
MNHFSKVLDDELELIKKQLGNNRGAEKSKENLTGLAFSGGGIRSATFNLGIIQSLAGKNLLGKFDYLSTVSGGGYIGSWLSAQIHRHPRNEEKPETAPDRQRVEAFQESLRASRESGAEHDSIKWLRSYSNYLTPRKGWSGDTFAAIGTWLRNTLLNQVTLGLLFALLLLFLQVMLLTLNSIGWIEPRLRWLLLSLLLTFCAVFLCAAHLPKPRSCTGTKYAVMPKDQEMQPILLIILMAILAAYSRNLWIYSTSLLPNSWMNNSSYNNANQISLLKEIFGTLAIVSKDGMLISSPLFTAIESIEAPALIAGMWAIIYVLPWIGYVLYFLIGYLLKGSARPHTQDKSTGKIPETFMHTSGRTSPSPFKFALGILLSALTTGAFGGWLIYLLSHAVAQQNEDIRLWWATGFGTPLLLLIFCLILVLHQGLMARLFRVSQLEWWARLGGYVLLVAVAWTGIHILLIYIPPMFDMLERKFIAAGGLAWVTSSLAGAIFGKSPGSSEQKNARWKGWITRVAPYVFVLGYLVATSWAVHALMFKFGTERTPDNLNLAVTAQNSSPPFSEFLRHSLLINNNADIIGLWYVLISGSIVFLVLAWRLDVNLFSIHHFYRNRLTRCYLGAGRGDSRIPNSFTGFDPCDDITLAELKQRPLHLVNTALNLVHDGNLAWQDRKAFSFTFSPVACGFHYPPNASQQGGGYYDSMQYMGGVQLGTAMATSGAAASPNMGYHSSPAVAFLLTVFNVRLGHWCPNPEAKAIRGNSIRRKSPAMGGEYLLKELFGQTDDKDAFVYLSDGGHFENLGVYELVRRRCRYIMVVDAGQDEERTFEDAANLIRKCYIDFGVTIDIRLDELRADTEGNSPSCYALGDIVYPALDGDKNAKENGHWGVLLYIKPSLLKDIPEDVRQYAKTNGDFPHQTTGDQFFDEAQFESYRHLGNFLMDEVIESIGQHKSPRGNSWSWDGA